MIILTLYCVESTEGISEIWFCEPFPRWGFLRFRVRVRSNGKEFTRSYSETPLWSNSGFDSHLYGRDRHRVEEGGDLLIYSLSHSTLA